MATAEQRHITRRTEDCNISSVEAARVRMISEQWAAFELKMDTVIKQIDILQKCSLQTRINTEKYKFAIAVGAVVIGFINTVAGAILLNWDTIKRFIAE